MTIWEPLLSHSGRLFMFITSTQSAAQQLNQSTPGLNKLEAIPYRAIFRRVLTYQKKADAEELVGGGKSHYRSIVARRLELSDFDDASLRRISLDYEKQSAPLQKQISDQIKQFRAKSVEGVRSGMDMSPPPALAELEIQEDAVVLLHRDLLRNAMRPDDYKRMQENVNRLFGSSPLASGTAVQPNPQGAR